MASESKLPDPRVVFALALYFSAFGMVIRTPLLMGVLFSVCVGAAAWLGVDLIGLIGRFKRLWQVALMTALMQSFFAPSGTVLVEIGGVALVTAGGLGRGLSVLFRLMTFIVTGAMFTQYGPSELIQGMVKIRLPYEVAYMVSVGVRFVPRFAEELRDGLVAIQLRGVVFEEMKFQARVKVYGYLLMPVLASSLHSAQELSMSMDMRAFRAYEVRTSYRELIMDRRSKAAIVAVLAMGAVTAIVVIMSRMT